MLTLCRKIATSLLFFRFMANFGAIWKPAVKFTFSLTVTFYLAKTGNRVKKSLAQLSHYCFE